MTSCHHPRISPILQTQIAILLFDPDLYADILEIHCEAQVNGLFDRVRMDNFFSVQSEDDIVPVKKLLSSRKVVSCFNIPRLGGIDPVILFRNKDSDER